MVTVVNNGNKKDSVLLVESATDNNNNSSLSFSFDNNNESSLFEFEIPLSYGGGDHHGSKDDDFNLSMSSSASAQQLSMNTTMNTNNKNNYNYNKNKKKKKKNTNNSNNNELLLATKETKAVTSVRLIVVIVLILSTIGIAFGVYYFVSLQEQQKFITHFKEGSNKILGAIGRNLETTLAGMDVLSVSMVSFAYATNQSWPFVTIPDFAIRTAKIRSLSNLIFINHLPLVQPGKERLLWEEYSMDHSYWVNQSMKIQSHDPNYYGPKVDGDDDGDFGLYGIIHGDFDDIPYYDNMTRPMLPNWQTGPVIPSHDFPPFNYDYLSVTNPESLYVALNSKRSIITEAYGLPDKNNPDEVEEAEAWYEWYKNYIPPNEDSTEPVSDLYCPIIPTLDSVNVINPNDDEDDDDDDSQQPAVGLLAATWYWRDFIKDLLPEGSIGFIVVFENPCNPPFTYQLNGPSAVYLGRGDLHQSKYDGYAIQSQNKDLGSYSLISGRHSYVPVNDDYCPFHISVYPSDDMKNAFSTQDPIVYMLVSISIFMFATCLFIMYDCTVRRRHMVVMDTAVASNAVVSSLYPEVVRDRIKQDKINKQNHQRKLAKSRKKTKQLRRRSSREQLTLLREDISSGKDCYRRDDTQNSSMNFSLVDDDFNNNSSTTNLLLDGNHIAEVYPETTVMMADIFGFSAWSSAREPTKVFFLLESIYNAFDELCLRYSVFKIESVGDMYVTVCGLPNPEKRHAVIMTEFAQVIRTKMKQLVMNLERRLGPGTGDLRLRIGLNSGPVTGGVLRSEKSLFQIFGDTVNVAARMQRTSLEDRIQASQKTANELINASREHWIRPRSEPFLNSHVDDTEDLATYWVEPPFGRASSDPSGKSSVSMNDFESEHTEVCFAEQLPTKVQRLVSWNLDQLESILVSLLAQSSSKQCRMDIPLVNTSRYPRSERSETIFLANSDKSMISESTDPPVLDNGIRNLLNDFITSIAFMYQENSVKPYHDFEHSANAAMSVMKFLSTLANQEQAIEEDLDRRVTYMHLILSDSMVQFSLIFSVLIHCVAHPGLTNSQLVGQKSPVAKRYVGKSVSQQHSIDVAWELFMDPGYNELRMAIFKKPSDLLEFRKLVVNAVMATDLEDPELKVSRDSRWKELFEEDESPRNVDIPDGKKKSKKEEYNHNRRAMLVIEFVVQASVIAEYMQHWNTYEKYRRLYYNEMMDAYKQGAIRNDPSETWYEQELLFFDNFVIPLLDNIKRCGVFGSSCGEMLEYAISNRDAWEIKGVDMVDEWKNDRNLAGRKSEKGPAGPLFHHWDQ